MSYVVVTDPLVRPLGGQRPGVAWGAELARSGGEVTIIAPCVGDATLSRLRGLGLRVRAPPCRSRHWIPLRSFLTALLRRGVRGNILNFSNQYAVPSSVYYFQGFLTNLAASMALSGNWEAGLGLPLFSMIDAKWVVAMARSRRVVSNSPESARQLARWGMRSSIVPPPIPMDEYEAYRHASPGKWGSDYVLVMIGKETKWEWLRPILDRLRNRVILFGGAKIFHPPRWLPLFGRHVGFVEEMDMPSLYAGAALTIFTYTHEPFGYVPLEAAAAGSPSLVVGGPHGPACYAGVIRGIHHASPRDAPDAAPQLLNGDVDREAALRALNPSDSLPDFMGWRR
ncbi:MAG: hypothetical protein ACP5NY_04235 [Thermocladium sp.]